MSGKMKTMYRKFSDIVIFDDAERTNKHGYLLVGFQIVTNENKVATVAFGFLNGINEENYKWVWRKFIESVKIEPGVLITTFDSLLSSSVESLLTNTLHLFC
jgi:hypothetical protein